MAKPAQWTFDKTQLAPAFEAIYDKAAAVIPIWEGTGTTVTDLKSGATGTIVSNGGDGLGPDWATDAEGVHLTFPGDAATTGRYIDFNGTALTGLTYDEATVVGVVRTLGQTLTDDGLFWRHEKSTTPLASVTNGFTDDAGQVGKVRFFVEGDGVFEPVYSNTNVNDGNVHTIIGRRQGEANEVSVDGGAFVSAPANTIPAWTADQGPFIGDDPGATEQWEGPIYAVYAFTTALTDTEKDTIANDPYGLIRQSTGLQLSVTFADNTINETGVTYVIWDNPDPSVGSVVQSGTDAQIANGQVNLPITAPSLTVGQSVHLMLRKGTTPASAWTGVRAVESA